MINVVREVEKIYKENSMLRLQYYKACILLAEANQSVSISNMKGIDADKWQRIIQRMVESQLRGNV